MEDNLTRIGIGIAATAFATLILYLFRMRQLYVTVPLLFDYNELTHQGKTFQLSIINKSRQMEEEIRVELDPALKYLILASSNTGITCDKNVLSIPRVPAMSTVSVIMISEGGDFGIQRISDVSSKSHKGKILSHPNKVPPNWGNYALMFVGLAAAYGASMWAISAYFDHDRKARISERDKVIAQLKHFERSGWSSFDQYALSTLRKSYSDQELPVTIASEDIRSGRYSAVIVATNKTANILTIDAFYEDVTEGDAQLKGAQSAMEKKIEPNQSVRLSMSAPLKGKEPSDLTIHFNFRHGQENIYGLTFKPRVTPPLPLRSPKGLH